MLSRFSYVWFAVAVIIMSANLRGNFTSISYISSSVQEYFYLSNNLTGILLSLPSIIFAIFSIFIATTAKKLGLILSGFLGIVLIFIGILLRSYVGLSGLFIGTAILSLGITFGNVLFPVYINTYFQKNFGLMNSICVTNLSISAVVGTFLSSILFSIGWSWKSIGAIWIVVSAISLVLWIPLFFMKLGSKKNSNILILENNLSGNKSKSIFKLSAAWGLAICLGIQSSNFFTLISWLPARLDALNFTNLEISAIINGFQLVGIPVSFFTPIFMMKYKDKVHLLATILGVIYFLSLFLLTMDFVKDKYIITLINMIIAGIAAGAMISLLMTLVAMKGPNQIRTTQLSGMVQSISFIIAALGTWLFGLLLDITNINYEIAMFVIFIIPTFILVILLHKFANTQKIPE